jgi:prepilin peptidase CpaA
VTDLTARLGGADVMALVITVTAALFDLRTRRIPNALTLGGAAFGLAYGLVMHGLAGLATSTLGWVAGLAVFLPFFLLGGLGAGDVKLVACLGAWLGASVVVWVAIYAALAGGVMAIVVALATGYLRAAVDNLYLLLSHFRVAGVRPHPELTLERGRGPRLPYALPIAAGTVAAIWLH